MVVPTHKVLLLSVLFVSATLLAANGSCAKHPTANIVYSRLYFEIDPAIRQVKGVVTHYLLTAHASDTLYLLLSDSLQIDSIVYHGSATTWLRPGDGQLILPLQNELTNVLDSISVFYSGIPPENGTGSFQNELHQGVPIVWTLSEPYGASDWWPCQNALTDKIDSLDLVVKCPSGNKVASNGLLYRREHFDDFEVWHWRHRYPIADYLVAFAITNYAYYEEYIPVGSDTIFVANYVYPEDSADRRTRTGWIHDVYRLFSDLFGPYPFLAEKYGHAEMNRGGGMEHQTMTFIGSFDYEVMVHELAHQWFGDAITCGSWYDLWLNEGWATYSAALAYEHLQGGIYWKPWKDFWRNYVTSEPDGVVQTLDTLNVPRLFDSRLTYGKAAYTLHMLRWVMTDSLFYQATRQYLDNPELSMGFAKTGDFKSHMEHVSGLDLETFFWQWLQGEGYPTYQVSWNQINDTLSLLINQSTSHPSVDFFQMPLPLTVFSAGEATQLRLDNDSQDQAYRLWFPSRIDSILFDPDLWLLTGNNQVSGIQETDYQHSFIFYPNPSRQEISILTSSEGVLSIFDLLGNQVFNLKIQAASPQNVDIKGLEAGVYQIHFDGASFRANRRMIKL